MSMEAWRRVFDSPAWAASFVFLLAFALRVLLDVVFYLRFGWHAANHAEAWLYAGVMDGALTTAGGALDPTVWLLRGVGGVIPAGLSYHAVVLTAAALSALTAAALYLLVKELTDQKTGLYAGLLYAGMVEPLALSTAGFTHDHLQLLAIVASLYLAVKATKSGLAAGILYSAAYYLLADGATRINTAMNVGIMVAAAYVVYALLEYILALVAEGSRRDVYPAYIVLAIAMLFALGGTVLAPLTEASLYDLPQGRWGSADVKPVGLSTFWLRYNVLLLLIPAGVVQALRRRDVIGLSLTVTGFILAGVMDRGTRIGDLGVAMLAAYALSAWGRGRESTVVEAASWKRTGAQAETFILVSFAWLAAGYWHMGGYGGLGLSFSGFLVISFAAAIASAAALLEASGWKVELAVRKVEYFLADYRDYPVKLARACVKASPYAAFFAAALYVLGLWRPGSEVPAVSGILGVSYTIVPEFIALALLAFAASAAGLAASSWSIRRLNVSVVGEGALSLALAGVYSVSATAAAMICLAAAGVRVSDTVSYALILSGSVYLALLSGGRGTSAKAAAACGALAFAYAALNTDAGFRYLPLFAAAAAYMLHSLWRGSESRAVAAIIAVGVIVNLLYVHDVEARKIVTDMEYQVLSSLGAGGGRVLSAWDHGYIVEAVSGLKSVSNAGFIDWRTHRALWMPERQAAVTLAQAKVSYILLNDENFNVVRTSDDAILYKMMGGLLPPPRDDLPISLTDRLLIYRLRHNATGVDFRLVAGGKDSATGVGVLLYRVEANVSGYPADGMLVGGVAVNLGGEKTVRILGSVAVITNETYNRTYVHVADEHFNAGEVKELLYNLPGVNGTGCRLRAMPLDRRPWEFRGVLAYVNGPAGRESTVRAYLTNPETNRVYETYERNVSFRPGEKKLLAYSFFGADEYGDYVVDVAQADGLTLLRNETTAPGLDSVKVAASFC